MPEIAVVMMDSFVDGDTGGNPAGVVYPADSLTEVQMQKIASRADAPETVFISRSATAAVKLAFFTSITRIPHCGHATVAAFCYLSHQGILADGWTSKETIDGNRKVLLREGEAYIEQLAPVFQTIQSRNVSASDIMTSLGLDTQDLLPGFEPTITHTGNTFLVIPLANRDAQCRIRPDPSRIHVLSEVLGVTGYYPFCLQTGQPGRDAATRMFAPRVGISEESATGTAAGPLAGYLYQYLGLRKNHLVMEQGTFMAPQSPSLIKVDLNLTDDKIVGMMVGGKALLRGEKLVSLDI